MKIQTEHILTEDIYIHVATILFICVTKRYNYLSLGQAVLITKS